MKNLFIDLECRSSVDLTKSGVYAYAEAEDFEILLFGFSVDDGEVQVIDLANGETIPQEIQDALTDDSIIKWSYNANFERVALSRYLSDLGIRLDPFHDRHPLSKECARFLNPVGWRCTMVWSAYMGLPHSLAAVGRVLGLEEQKMTEGKSLIRRFCVPPFQKPEGEMWETFKSYNRRDVEVEMAIQSRLAKFPVPDSVWDEYHLDQEINDRGIRVDIPLVENAIRIDEMTKERLMSKMQELTGLENPNSVMQMKEWLSERGIEAESLDKKSVEALLKTAEPLLSDVLYLRQQLAKSSVKKYQAMQNATCEDNRARGMFQFYGANRTGRFAGRIVQLQNLPQNHLVDLEDARELVRQGNFDALDVLYDSIPDVLSQLIRTAFIPGEGRKFVVADFSAIEARVLSWLAKEKWRMDVFAGNGDIYCETASRMFHCPVVKHGENGHLRQKGKQAELACIAEGQLVLTDAGLIPIEKITKLHRLWDGERWVEHDGVIFKGEREVITFDGLTATADHLVWSDGQWMPFGSIATVRESSIAPVYDILNAGEHHRFTVSGKLVHNCGYGGSVGALKAFGALESGMKEDELKPLVDAWREANPHIVDFWWAVDRAAKECIKERSTTETHGLRFIYQSGMMFIELPSRRRLAYVKPRIGENPFGGESITYMGLDTAKKWVRLESYGPKLVENITQAISRDILCYAMKTLRCMDIVAHVHDELIIECDQAVSLDAVCKQMARTPPWAEGLVLDADGFEARFYMKA